MKRSRNSLIEELSSICDKASRLCEVGSRGPSLQGFMGSLNEDLLEVLKKRLPIVWVFSPVDASARSKAQAFLTENVEKVAQMPKPKGEQGDAFQSANVIWIKNGAHVKEIVGAVKKGTFLKFFDTDAGAAKNGQNVLYKLYAMYKASPEGSAVVAKAEKARDSIFYDWHLLYRNNDKFTFVPQFYTMLFNFPSLREGGGTNVKGPALQNLYLHLFDRVKKGDAAKSEYLAQRDSFQDAIENKKGAALYREYTVEDYIDIEDFLLRTTSQMESFSSLRKLSKGYVNAILGKAHAYLVLGSALGDQHALEKEKLLKYGDSLGEIDASGKTVGGRPDYKVFVADSPADIQKIPGFKKAVSIYNNGYAAPWCVITGPGAFRSYTDSGKFIIFLKVGNQNKVTKEGYWEDSFQTIPQSAGVGKKGFNDEYAASAFAVAVTPEGKINSLWTRRNIDGFISSWGNEIDAKLSKMSYQGRLNEHVSMLEKFLGINFETQLDLKQERSHLLFKMFGTTLTGILDKEGMDEIEVPKGVTKIDSAAFEGSKIVKVIVPRTVKEIGKAAFRECKGLKDIVFEERGEASISFEDECFFNCESLEEFSFPKGIEKIPSYAFSGCKKLKEINLSNTVKVIGPSAFRGLELLKRISLSEGVQELGSSAFFACSALESIEIPETVKSIGDGCFSWCTALKKAVLAGKGSSIGVECFSGCSALEEVTLDKGLQIIPCKIFDKCTSLKSVEIPGSVQVIEIGAFQGCSALKDVFIPNEVTRIGYSAFLGCTSLEKLRLPDNLEYLGNRVFEGMGPAFKVEISEKNKKYKVEGGFLTTSEGKVICMCNTGEEEVRIPDNASIYGFDIRNKAGLKRLILPESVDEVQQGFLSNCPDLEEVYFEGLVTNLDAGFADKCPKLKSITTKDEGIMALWDLGECKSLKKIDLSNDVVVSRAGAFSGCPKLPSLLLSKEGKTLVKVTDLKGKIEVPDGVKTIGDYAFSVREGEKGTEKIDAVFPESVEFLGEYLFSNYEGPVNLYFKGEIPKFSETSFSRSRSASASYFDGTIYCKDPAAWKKNSIVSSWLPKKQVVRWKSAGSADKKVKESLDVTSLKRIYKGTFKKLYEAYKV